MGVNHILLFFESLYDQIGVIDVLLNLCGLLFQVVDLVLLALEGLPELTQSVVRVLLTVFVVLCDLLPRRQILLLLIKLLRLHQMLIGQARLLIQELFLLLDDKLLAFDCLCDLSFHLLDLFAFGFEQLVHVLNQRLCLVYGLTCDFTVVPCLFKCLDQGLIFIFHNPNLELLCLVFRPVQLLLEKVVLLHETEVVLKALELLFALILICDLFLKPGHIIHLLSLSHRSNPPHIDNFIFLGPLDCSDDRVALLSVALDEALVGVLVALMDDHVCGWSVFLLLMVSV